MECVNLNEALLGVVLFVQRARSYYISKKEIFGKPEEWYSAVEEEYWNIPKKIFEKAGISKNAHNLERALHFEVTSEIMNCQFNELDKFKTDFWR